MNSPNIKLGALISVIMLIFCFSVNVNAKSTIECTSCTSDLCKKSNQENVISCTNTTD